MKKQNSIVAGLIMILVGAVFLLINLSPNLAERLDISRQWPLLIIIVGLFFLLTALFGTPSLSIPGCVISGIGGILYYQNISGNWASWSYIWALIPGFVGLGLVLMGLLDRRQRKVMREGGRLLLISAALFIVFGAFLGNLAKLNQFWPILLIGSGAWMLFRNRLSR